MYVCMYICMYVCIYMYIYVCMYNITYFILWSEWDNYYERHCQLCEGADLDFSQAEYRFDEDAGTVEVCMDLTNIPAEGLECDLLVPLTLVDGKASKRRYVITSIIVPHACIRYTYTLCIPKKGMQ